MAAAAELRLAAVAAASDAINSSAVFYLDPNVKTGLAEGEGETEKTLSGNLTVESIDHFYLLDVILYYQTTIAKLGQVVTFAVAPFESMVVCRMGLIIKSWMPPPPIGRPSAQ